MTARLIDRPIRPMFAKGFLDEVQCQAFVLSSDRQTDGDVLAMNGVSAACFNSPLPFEDPVASTRVGRIDGEFVAFPTQDQLEESDLDMIVSGTETAVTMIEGFAREMPEEDMLAAIEFAHGVIKEVVGLIRELAEKAPVQKIEFSSSDDGGLLEKLSDRYFDEFKSVLQIGGKQERGDARKELKDKALRGVCSRSGRGRCDLRFRIWNGMARPGRKSYSPDDSGWKAIGWTRRKDSPSNRVRCQFVALRAWVVAFPAR